MFCIVTYCLHFQNIPRLINEQGTIMLMIKCTWNLFNTDVNLLIVGNPLSLRKLLLSLPNDFSRVILGNNSLLLAMIMKYCNIRVCRSISVCLVKGIALCSTISPTSNSWSCLASSRSLYDPRHDDRETRTYSLSGCLNTTK